MSGCLHRVRRSRSKRKADTSRVAARSAEAGGLKARSHVFPDYGTSIGERSRALQCEREYGPDVMQLLYIANRYERKPDLQRWLDGGLTLVCDRYTPRSVAHGEAHGLDPAWLTELQKSLPPASLTIVPTSPQDGGSPQGGRARSLRTRSRPAGPRARSYRWQAAAGGGLWSTANARKRPSPKMFSAAAARLNW